MCLYCMMGDWQFRYNPPWNPPFPSPLIPMPINPTPVIPWDFTKLTEYYDILRRIKALEDKVGCPCMPNKADYLTIIKERLAALEKTVSDQNNPD